MRIGFKHVAFTAGAVAVAISWAQMTPMAAGQPTDQPAQPTPPTTVTVTVQQSAPGPQDSQACTSSSTATKCLKNGDAEINAAIPAPYPGVYGLYGPFWGGSAG